MCPSGGKGGYRNDNSHKNFNYVFNYFVKLFYFCFSVEFLSHVSTLACDIDIANLSVCVSVRPVLDENGLTFVTVFFTIQ